MISLRSFASFAGIAALAFAFSACSDSTADPVTGIRPPPSSANFSVSKTVAGAVDARVLLDKSGNAILDVHAGTFVDATNTGTPVGTLSSITYTVKDGSSHIIVNRTVNLKHDVASYITSLNLCAKSSGGDDDEHDDDDEDRWGSSSCSMRWNTDYKLTLTANLKGLGSDGKSSGSTSVDARILNLPDVDLSGQTLFVVAPGGAQSPASSIAPATPTTFSVALPNNKSIKGVANAVGVQTLCVVSVDGMPQVPYPSGQYNKFSNPNAFGYVGSATQSIAAGASGACQFTLTLPAGTHRIVVSAGVTYPGDYDPSNNSTANLSVNFETLNIPVDFAAGSVQRVGNGVNAATIVGLDTSKVGNVVTIRSVISNPTAKATAVNCTITADAGLRPTAVGSTTNVVVPANGTGVCQYTLSPGGLGSFPVSIAVAASAGSPVDPNSANNTASGTLTVVSGGQFTSINLSSTDLRQEWFNLLGSTAFPAESLSLQNVQVNQLALTVVPAQAIIGTFTLKGTVISGTTTFPTGTVTGTLHLAAAGAPCELVSGQNVAFANVPAGFPSQIAYSANICAEPTTVNGVSGFQRITVSYVQSLAGSLMNPGSYLLTGNVQIKMELAFTLQGAAADKATATVTIAVPTPLNRGLTSLDGTRVLWSEQNPLPPTVVTP